MKNYNKREIAEIDEKFLECEKMRKMYEKAEMQAVNKEVYLYVRDLIAENPKRILSKYLPSFIVDDMSERIIQRGKAQGRIFMFGLSPDEEPNIKEFIKYIIKCCKKIWIHESSWIIEKKTRKDGKHGIHCHIRIITNKKKKPSHVRRECANSFNKLGKNTNDIKMSYRPDAFVEYVKGYKLGKLKENNIVLATSSGRLN